MARSAWEKLTDGRCNNDLPLDSKPKRKPTAAQLKRQAACKRQQEKAANKFAVAATSQAASMKVSEHWFNRLATDTKGFYDPRKAKATA